MIKLNFFIINLSFLISFINMNECLGSEYIYIKQTFFSANPKPSISATSTDKTTKWFDDYPSAKSNDELEFGFHLPSNYGLSFRNSQLNGVHTGEATKYVCILGYCSYVGAGIVTGNSTTDKISYDINSLQVILDRSYELKNNFTLKPRIGINVLDTILQYSGTGQNVREAQIVPLPFLGLNLEIKISSKYSFYFDNNYFKYQQKKVSVHYYDTSIGINRKINEYINFYLGYKKYDLGISNKGGSSNISFDILQKTPFVGFSLSY